MEALVISIVIYMILVISGLMTYLLYCSLKKPKVILRAMKINSSKILSTTERITKLALSYKNGLITQSEFEIEKSQILG